MHTVTVLWLPYILVTVCTDVVTVRIGIAYSNLLQYWHMAVTAVATVHICSNAMNFIISSCVFSVTSATGNSNLKKMHLSASTHIDFLSTKFTGNFTRRIFSRYLDV